MSAEFLQAALGYAAQGLCVFPCVNETKRPAFPGGFKLATTNPALIQRWFGGTRPYNLAIRTGLASRAWVLDVDDRHGGFATLAVLERRYGPLPPTHQCRTADGIHFWWRAPCPVQGSEGRVGRGLGVKTEGGYAMAPPSLHPDGVIYEWANDEPIALPPEWLLKLTRKPLPFSSLCLPAPITDRPAGMARPLWNGRSGSSPVLHRAAATMRSTGRASAFTSSSREGSLTDPMWSASCLPPPKPTA
jgi:Bifunctional DNA primase/polymerase, N-terminal